MKKNKGIIVELTSLLDVILIMLFWVMMVSSDKADKAEQKAEEKVQAANAQAQVQIDQAKQDADRYINDRLAEQKDDLEKLNEYNKTIEGFENGEMLSISITYVSGAEGKTEMLSFARAGEQISSVALTDTSDIESDIKKVLDQLPNKNGIILAAFIYDGNVDLYQHVIAIRKALENLRLEYEGIYFAYINTSGKTDKLT